MFQCRILPTVIKVGLQKDLSVLDLARMRSIVFSLDCDWPFGGSDLSLKFKARLVDKQSSWRMVT